MHKPASHGGHTEQSKTIQISCWGGIICRTNCANFVSDCHKCCQQVIAFCGLHAIVQLPQQLSASKCALQNIVCPQEVSWVYKVTTSPLNDKSPVAVLRGQRLLLLTSAVGPLIGGIQVMVLQGQWQVLSQLLRFPQVGGLQISVAYSLGRSLAVAAGFQRWEYGLSRFLTGNGWVAQAIECVRQSQPQQEAHRHILPVMPVILQGITPCQSGMYPQLFRVLARVRQHSWQGVFLCARHNTSGTTYSNNLPINRGISTLPSYPTKISSSRS